MRPTWTRGTLGRETTGGRRLPAAGTNPRRSQTRQLERRRGGRGGGSISLFGVSLGGTSSFSNNMTIDMYAGTLGGEHDIFGHDGPPTTSGSIYSY